jgi:flavin-binding protein dodecin
MNMKYKLLTAAVASTIGMVGAANAVNLSETGTGQVLIFPYYTVQDNNATLLTVHNTTTAAKAVKVRFRESLNSREVLDFNLYLSPNDIWTGAVTKAANGAAMLSTTDTSCTVPAIPAEGVEFRNFAYIGTAPNSDNDAATDAITRTAEGYFEVIEMGNVASVDIDPTAATVNFVTAVTHTGTGVDRAPANCAAVVNGWASVAGDGTDSSFVTFNTVGNANAELTQPTGGITGSASIINVAAGSDFSFDPVTIDNWAAAGVNDSLHAYPGNESPALGNGDLVSNVITGGNVVLSNLWADGWDAVSSVLMRSRVMNEFTVEADLLAGTDFIVTFPTKHHYVTGAAAAAPFQAARPFTSTGACQTVSLRPYDREELTPGGATGGVDFSPRPVGTPTENSLCWEVNVVTFNDSNVLGSANSLNIPVDYENGWLDMSFTSSRLLTSAASTSNGAADAAGDDFAGLPVIGVAAQNYVNGNVGGLLSNYGGSFGHKFETDITNN